MTKQGLPSELGISCVQLPRLPDKVPDENVYVRFDVGLVMSELLAARWYKNTVAEFIPFDAIATGADHSVDGIVSVPVLECAVAAVI